MCVCVVNVFPNQACPEKLLLRYLKGRPMEITTGGSSGVPAPGGSPGMPPAKQSTTTQNKQSKAKQNKESKAKQAKQSKAKQAKQNKASKASKQSNATKLSGGIEM